MELPTEIAEARTHLERAEKEYLPDRKIEELEEGIKIIEYYLEDNPTPFPEVAQYITNLRRSHTRRLLSQLPSIKKAEINVWFSYIILIFTKLINEITFITDEDPELKRNYEEFYGIWKKELEEAFKSVRIPS